MRLCEKNSKPLGSRTIRMQRSNDVEEPDECRHRFLLQVLSRQARENRLVYVILAEGRLTLPEAQAPQPDHDVARNQWWRASSAGEARVSRVAFGFSGLRKHAEV